MKKKIEEKFEKQNEIKNKREKMSLNKKKIRKNGDGGKKGTLRHRKKRKRNTEMEK